MLNRYRAYVRDQPEREFWKAEFIAEPLIGTEAQIKEHIKHDVLARGTQPSHEPTRWLSKSDANWIASHYRNAVIVIEDNDLVAAVKSLFRR